MSQKSREDLEKEVHHLEQEHKRAPTLLNLKALLAAKSLLNLDHTNETKKQLLLTKQKHYEHGNKSSRLLAHQLKSQINNRSINMIKAIDSKISYDFKIINDTFKSFYKSLYSSKNKNMNIKDYLQNIDLPVLSEGDVSILNADFTSEDILAAIKALPSGKSPGLDGFPIEFYKTFWPEIKPIFMGAVNHIWTGMIPQFWNCASISLLLKKGKDPSECTSYRPISLLNADYKIVAKAFAQRLEKMLPKIIHCDQAGFVKARYGCDNVRRTLDIIHQVSASKDPAFIFSLDADKAFDRVEWSFLFEVLDKFGLGPKFVGLIKSLYSQSMAQVNTNGLLSESFPVQRGCRQGCPLSPLLFTLFIELLAQKIRFNTDIKGISAGGKIHTISLFADDILLYLSNPLKSIEVVLTSIMEFSVLSGYKINLCKSTVLPLNVPPAELTNLPFQITKGPLKYLGINLTSDLNDLFDANYTSLICKLKEDLTRWSSLPTSWLGRVNVVKMHVLPRLNYLFQNLPCYLSNQFFKKLNKIIAQYLWKNKSQRIKYNTLTKPKNLGGVQLPDFQLYYWSAQLRMMTNWILKRQEAIWAELESSICSPLKPEQFLFIDNITSVEKIRNNVIIYNTWLVWKDVKKYLKIPPIMSVYSPLFSNPDIPEQLRSVGLSNWVSSGINNLSDLMFSNIMKSFDQLRDEFNIPVRDFYKYLQIRNFINSLLKENKLRFSLSKLEYTLISVKSLKGKISEFYTILSQQHSNDYDLLKQLWERDLGTTYSIKAWSQICKNIFPKCTSLSIHEQNYKLIHRFYYTPVRLQKMFPDNSDLCCKCKIFKGTLVHLLWDCEYIKQFWKSIHDVIQQITGKTFDMSTSLYLLNLYPEGVFDNAMQSLLSIVMSSARKCILSKWSLTQAPTLDMWLTQITSIISLEKLTFELNGKPDMYWKIWSPLHSYLQTKGGH